MTDKLSTFGLMVRQDKSSEDIPSFFTIFCHFTQFLAPYGVFSWTKDVWIQSFQLLPSWVQFQFNHEKFEEDSCCEK